MVISSRRSQEIIFRKVIHLSYQFDDIYVVFMSCIINTYTLFQLMDVLDIGRWKRLWLETSLSPESGCMLLWMIGWRPHQVFNHCTPYFGTIYWRLTNDFIETFLFYRLKNNCDIVIWLIIHTNFFFWIIIIHTITYHLQIATIQEQIKTNDRSTKLIFSTPASHAKYIRLKIIHHPN